MKLYQVDAFTDRIFSGNPAAICPLHQWLDSGLLQKIAMENNLPETAFYVPHGDAYEIRWFTPTVEVDLCGHATLAAAYVLFHHELHAGDTIHFLSPRSGELIVRKQGEFITLNFPTDAYQRTELNDDLMGCFDRVPTEAFKGKTDYMLVFADEDQIRTIKPDFERIAELDARGVIVTARGNEVDFVSRFFGPRTGIKEDPVTGSAHTTLIPYWASVLDKEELVALQLSDRQGHLKGKYLGDRVEISGQGRLYLEGEIYIG